MANIHSITSVFLAVTGDTFIIRAMPSKGYKLELRSNRYHQMTTLVIYDLGVIATTRLHTYLNESDFSRNHAHASHVFGLMKISWKELKA